MKGKECVKRFNTLGYKVYISLILISIIPLFLYLLLNNIAVSKNIHQIEIADFNTKSSQLKSILNMKIDEISKVARDYGIWDDTYNKIDKKDKAWFEDNFSGWIPENTGIDLLAVIDNDMNIVDSYGTIKIDELMDNMSTTMLHNTFNGLRHSYPKGIKVYNGDLYLIGMSPVLKNDGSSDSKGVVILGKKIDEKFIREIELNFGYINFISFGDKFMTSNDEIDAVSYMKQFSNSKKAGVFKTFDNETLGKVPLYDISGSEIASLFVIEKNDIHSYTLELIYRNGAIIFIICLIIIAYVVRKVDKALIMPIKNLEIHMGEISVTNSIEEFEINGLREIMSLKNTFNKMMGNIKSHHERVSASLRELSITDETTSLYNHRYFHEYFKELLENGCEKASILFCDIDYFKKINDSKGHVNGDIVLKHISRTLEEAVGKEGLVFRYGGEEFVVLLNNYSSKDSYELAERIRKNISRLKFSEKGLEDLQITISIGGSCYPRDSVTINDLVDKADKAMYYAKQNGRNQCCIYSREVEGILEPGYDEHDKMDMLFKSVYALDAAIDAKDSYTGKHSECVAKYALLLAEKVGMNGRDRHLLRIGALLHDCGKIGIPDEIINKKDNLTDSEWELMKSHPVVGSNIINHFSNDKEIEACVKYHHESWDGKGYPQGFSGEKIPYHARIVCIADAYHAMISNRPYRKGLAKREAIAQLRKYKGIQFDPSLVEPFIEILLDEK